MDDGKSGGSVPDAVWKMPRMPPSPPPAMKTVVNDFFSHERDDKAVRSPILTEQIISFISAAADFNLDFGRTS